MRIETLYIQKYRVLYELTIPLIEGVREQETSTYQLDLIVGVNGTGKSTLLRLLAELFQRLEENIRGCPFRFSIRYQLHRIPEHPITVTVSNRDEDRQSLLRADQSLNQGGALFVRIENAWGERVEEYLIDQLERRLLPGQVVAFTSGSEAEWEVHDDRHYESPSSGLPDFHLQQPDIDQQLATWYGDETAVESINIQPERTESPTQSNFLFIKQEHFQQVILCGLLVDMDTSSGQGEPEHIKKLQDALKEAKIRRLAGFSLKFHRPLELLDRTDRAMFQDLRNLATHTVQLFDDMLLIFDLSTISTEEGADRVHPNSTLIHDLLGVRGNGLELFKSLTDLAKTRQGGNRPPLHEVTLFLERSPTEPERQIASEQPPLHTLEWFSDGEISFLGRLCLLSLLSEHEALILLDEPEVHFNDYWKRQLVHMLDQLLGGQHSHVVMTTHSSITLSDVYNTNIWVLKRHGHLTDYIAPPNLRTLGTDPSDIIVHIFEADSASGARGVEYINHELRTILTMNINNLEKRERLKRLEERIGPSPWRYAVRREWHGLEVNERLVPEQQT